MNEKSNQSVVPNRIGWRIAGWGAAAALLALPALAMLFTQEVAWTGTDFVVMGGMLLTLGLAIEAIARFVTETGKQLILGGLAVLAFLAVWAELAVGIVG